MGTWYLIVNTERREYLDMRVFGDHEKTDFTDYKGHNLHLVALKWLLVSRAPNSPRPPIEDAKETYAGLWNGTKTYIVSDHDERTDLVPEDEPNPSENLYGYAVSNYRNISQPVFKELFSKNDYFWLKVVEIIEKREWGASYLIHSLENIEVGKKATDWIGTAGLLEDYYRAEKKTQNRTTG